MSKYTEKFKDPRWQKKRLKILERDKFKCQECGSKKDTLHIHHKYYENDKDSWEYPDTALITLCEFCHKMEQSGKKDFENQLIKSLYNLGFLSADIGSMASAFNNFKLVSDRLTVSYGLYKFLSNPSNHIKIVKIAEDDFKGKNNGR